MKFLKNQFKNTIIAGTFCSLSLFSICSSATIHKHVAVPPQDISAQHLPSPQSRGTFSHSTMLPVFASQAKAQSQTITLSIPFDGQGDSPIIFLSPNAHNYTLSITDPNGRVVIDESAQHSLPTTSAINIGQQEYQGRQFVLQSPSVGQWTVELSPLKNTRQIISNGNRNKLIGYLMFKGDTRYELLSHLNDNMTLQNRALNITAYMVDSSHTEGDRKLSLKQTPLDGAINQAVATITTPSQKHVQIRLADDGLNGDKVAGDGIYSAPVPTDEIGNYTSQIQVSGIRPDGAPYSRTVTNIYPIEAQTIRFLKSSARLSKVNDHQLQIGIPVAAKESSKTVFLAAEIWGTSASGTPQAAAWAGGLVFPITKNSQSYLELNFDSRWIKRQGLRAPFKLKNLRLHASHNHVPLAIQKQMPLNASRALSAELLKAASTKSMTALAITSDMLMGVAPSQKVSMRATESKLLLVHGYCSGSVWNTADFSNSAEFQDYKENRSHDDFALLIRDFGAAYHSFGIVAHSQGGAAALHLYARYWSGLDNATSGRRIQSLGTPYQGTSLAGNLALLGQIFGIGCGTNTDLTYNGAANWLSTIPNWARAEVDYYTTSFATKWWRWDYCNIGSDLLLRDPEDGTTEKWSGQLSGAVNKGHRKGWCHTRKMRDPAQYTDSSRNASMNSRAAR